ncbi:alpha/beta hydrolase [Fructobacillus sp. M2-14]|uniref:Alpha/beta hydrolase n=1 Tax=Fructobacillus broussonetiae TaxID=2713173 RepID=A0ABS5QZP4_9LACO|nr:alpha/beta hydrolase [Fructobacillus broussonetiae]MBS9338135.1 alpha/beta hydrolase [Fructobacillus broussonetiae]
MKKHKHSRVRTVLIIALVCLIGYAGVETFSAHNRSNPAPEKQSPKTATVFFHGYGSSRNAEKSMSKYLVDHGYSNRRMDVTVSKSGEVTMGRTLSKNDKNPLILVQFDDNKNQDFNKTAVWVQTIMANLKKQGVNQVNLIGHSMGNMAIASYLMASKNAETSALPEVKKQIDIAGTYNGLMVTEKDSNSALKPSGEPFVPTDYFRRLLGLKTYYENHAVQVLNIYGNSQGGAANDTTVYNNSSKSLRFFVQNPSTYQEKLISGEDGQHSKLHESKEVDEAILAFLKK